MQKEKKESVNKRIITDLRGCGHFLHYKMGGKSGRRRIFHILSEQGELQQRELQEILGVQSGSLSEILSKIEADGYIEKNKCEKDRRNYNLRLTPKGKEKAIQLQRVYEEKVEQLLSCFTKKQTEDLLEMLDVLLEHWNTIDDMGMMDVLENEKHDLIEERGINK